jgi:hypothetical protein
VPRQRPFFRQLWGDGPVVALRMRLKVYGARPPAYESNFRLWMAAAPGAACLREGPLSAQG